MGGQKAYNVGLTSHTEISASYPGALDQGTARCRIESITNPERSLRYTRNRHVAPM